MRETEATQAATPVQPSMQAWEPAVVPARPVAPSPLKAGEGQDFRPVLEDNDFELTEPVPPPRANLIEFPRELVAPRKRRPRRAEGPLAANTQERQLNIFEVDPGALLMEPGAAGGEAAWPAPAWSGMELEAQPPAEPEPQDAPASLPALRLAPMGLRLTAALVDGALIAAALLGAALAAAASIGDPLPAGIARISVLLGLLLAYLLYQTIFFTLDEATPGMRCAGLFLCTFDGQSPTSTQLRRRLSALLLSVLPVGLGVAWILLDDDHLCWHDRLSKTYLRTG